jgi:RND superfamily putative drug exporter
VQGQRLIAGKFSPGRAAPLSLVADISSATAAAGALGASPLVEGTTQVNQSADRKLMLVDVTLAVSPFSDEAADGVPQLRDIARRASDGRLALLGGLTAETHDSREAQSADARLIVPLTLLLLFLIVAALVRAVVAPLYLVATVVLSYAFALGAASLIFTHVFGQPDSDAGLPLFAFIFLVALGVDYNIFLIGRIREEHVPGRTGDAVIAGLTRTGGVITSAGLILAGTFASLMSLPVVGLVQIGFTIALGLVVDTFLIRIFLVPAIAMLLGERNWWPSRRPGHKPVALCQEAV